MRFTDIDVNFDVDHIDERNQNCPEEYFQIGVTQFSQLLKMMRNHMHVAPQN